MKKGYFITFEGPDGSGKTTISTIVYEKLSEMGYPVVYTREPGGIELAEKIRDLILDPNNVAMDAKTEALLYAASRRQHLIEKIIPSVNEHKIVISDRFVDSSLAYQGMGRQLGIGEIYNLNMFAIEGYLPDITIYLDVSPELGLKRIESRQYKDRLDQEGLAFHLRVSQGYQVVKEQYKDRLYIVDASQSIEAIVNQVLTFLIDWMNQHEA